MLRDAAGFPVHHAGLTLTADGANHVQKAGLAVVNVSENRYDGLSVVAAQRRFAFLDVGDLVVGHGFTTGRTVL